MPITYPEGGMPGLLLRQRRARVPAIDTFKVQLVPMRDAPKVKIGGPSDVARLVQEMENYDRESAKIIHLDTKNQVMGVETISIGSLNASIVHPRETVKGAILNNSANVIFVHNHPSGICQPSNEDVEITGKLKEAFALVGIELLDSIIVGKGCHYSLREVGFLGGTTGKTPGVMQFAEPAQQVTAGKVEFISAMTEYITAPDLERRKLAAGKLQKSRYFNKEWFDKFFYPHDPKSAKENLMKFFVANEQGLGTVNYAYYGVISDYLRAISKPVLEVREGRAGAEVDIKYEPGKIFPFRVVYAGTDTTVQTREYPEAMAYYTEREAERGIIEEGLTQVKKNPHIVSENAHISNLYASELLEKVVKENWDIWGYNQTHNRKLNRDEALDQLRKHPKTIFYYSRYYKDDELAPAWLLSAESSLDYGYNVIVYPTGQIKPSNGASRHTISENIQTTNNIEVFLNRLTVDTSRYSRAVPIPERSVIGAAVPEDGFLFAYHVTDNPEEVMRKLRSNIPLCQMNPEGDLGCGFYVSGVPQYWFVRSREKWEFARNLNRAQRQALVTVILSDPKYRKGGGYLADFEVDYLNRDLKQFVETGDVNLLAMTGNQPYNVRITEEIARKAGAPVPKMPRMIKVKLQGKFISAEGLYSNLEVLNRAQAWAVINRPKMLQYDKRASTQNMVNAWLCSMGYRGAFTKSGMTTNPEMAIWDRKAIINAWIPEPQT